MAVHLPVSGTRVNIEFDPDEIRQRYAEERDKRANPETVNQFQGLSDAFAAEDLDRYAQPLEREPVVEDVEVAMFGGGFGGLLAGAHLTQQGVTNFRIIEQAGDFGGTWYWNRYPGVQCDVESHIYLPLLEETGHVPSKRYTEGAENLEHAQRIGRHFDLYDKALFQTLVISAEWLEEDSRWQVRTDRGDVIRARFIMRANGPLSKPQIPRLAGINDFQGKVFHTSRWDYEYTGGGPDGNLENLRDKRVAVVGTGATGVQAIPFLAKDAKELFVIQRTPTLVGPRLNRPTDPQWADALEPGWQAARLHNFNSIAGGHPVEEDLVDDYTTGIFRSISGQSLIDVPVSSLPPADQYVLMELADMQAVQDIHRRIDATVADQRTAEALKPWYGLLCKRPTPNDDYLDAFNSPSVTLVASPNGIDGITATGLVVDGVHYDVDCIVFATGFETTGRASADYGYDIVGRDGQTLRTSFADGVKTLHGFMTTGFPNFLELGLSQNAYLINFGFMLDRKARHAARIVAHALENGVADIEPDADAQQQWVDIVRAAFEPKRQYLANCTPGYYNGQGDQSRGFLNDAYSASEIEFWQMIDQWWEAGTFEGLVLNATPAAAR